LVGKDWEGWKRLVQSFLVEIQTDSAVCACLEFDDGATCHVHPGTKFYIGRTARPDTDATLGHVFEHDVDTVWRKVSVLHCNISIEDDVKTEVGP
jgi:hypothetical protein